MSYPRLAGPIFLAICVSILIGCGSTSSPSIAMQPVSQTVTTGQSAVFVVTAAGSSLTYQWQKNGAQISGATGTTYTTPPASTEDDGSTYRVVIMNSAGSVTSDMAAMSVHDPQDVITYHNDNARTGQNLSETFLNYHNVNSTAFGKVGFWQLDGKVDAQPLFLGNVNLGDLGTHNVLYVETEHNSVYAIDADTGVILWQVSLTGANETTSDARGCDGVSPEIGITATPVIDRTRAPNGAIYLVAMTKDSSKNYHQRVHALDVASGAELFGGPSEVQASYPGTGDNSAGGFVVFDPKMYKERASLVLVNDVVYTTWASHCDIRPYTGWVIGYDASTLAQTSVFNITPNGSKGAIWMSNGGPAADSAGNLYLLDANGTFDTTLDSDGFPINKNFGNTFLKLSTANGLSVADYFEQFDWLKVDGKDFDLGSGGVLLLPDFTDSSGRTRHLAVGAGKDSSIYLVDRDNMGKFNPANNDIYQEISTILPKAQFSTPAYFNNAVYFGPAEGKVEMFAIGGGYMSAAPMQTSTYPLPYPGSTPSISANGLNHPILWTVENYKDNAVLRAYKASDLTTELYDSNQAATGRDQFGPGIKFATPLIANGKVYVSTPTGVAVFGLLK